MKSRATVFLCVMAIANVLAIVGCASTSRATVADRQLERDIVSAIVAHGSAGGRTYNPLGMRQKHVDQHDGTVCELWSIRESWTDRWSEYKVAMTTDENGETDFVIQAVPN